ncbi:chemotaxis protein CheX [Simiduia curdlanivorans]|uniref:Chemotaxis protein CheX n=1 Tax=Simiduia curdlanivorans TaxID=1492769 RepID=A0ABV8V8D2_9GAMM|nr:chemotaxis protein CheX [Simiduia curdlanivorans]MDN3639497.1 chemotaxis protein CheX [Simiduia curdlanivorans]
MNSRLIQPFYNALEQVLLTMAQLESNPGATSVKSDATASGAVSGVIALESESLSGSMAISFSRELILDIFRRMLGQDPVNADDELCDLVGEITNMVTGAAKPGLVDIGINLDLSRPTTVSGANHRIEHLAQGPVLSQQLIAHTGLATLEVCLHQRAQ